MRDAGEQQRTKDALLEAGVRGLRIILVALVMFPQLSGPLPVSAQASSPNEYSVKAAFLFTLRSLWSGLKGRFKTQAARSFTARSERIRFKARWT
jgi:hypothetical protein